MWSFHLIVLARLLVGSPGVISISATGRCPFSPFGSHPPWSLHSEDRDRVPDTSGSLEARRPLVLVLGAASGNAEGRAGHWGLGLTPPLCSLSSGRPQQPKRLSSEGAATFPRTSVLQPQVQVPVGPAELGGLLEGLEGTGFPKRDESLRLFILPYSLHWGVSQHSDTGSLFLAVASTAPSIWKRTRRCSRCFRRTARDEPPRGSPVPFGSCRKPWRLRREVRPLCSGMK